MEKFKTIRQIIIVILTYNLLYPRSTHIYDLYLTAIESNDTHNCTTDSLEGIKIYFRISFDQS